MSTNQQQTTGQRAAFSSSATTQQQQQQQRRRAALKTPTTAAALEEQLSKLASQFGLPVAGRRSAGDNASSASPPSTSLNTSFTDISNYTPGVHSFSFRPIGDDVSQDDVDAIHGGLPRAQTAKTLAEEFLRRDDAGTSTYID